MTVYERLSGPEKAALVRQWQAFADASLRGAVVPQGSVPVEVRQLVSDAGLQKKVADTREAYLWSIESRWFQITFSRFGSSIANGPKLPASLFEQGQSLDDILWELHPESLFAELEHGTFAAEVVA